MKTFCIKSNGLRTVIGTIEHFTYAETGYADCGPAVDAPNWLAAKARYDELGLTFGLGVR